MSYTLILSLAYYIQLGETAFVLMFSVLLLTTIVFTILTIRTVRYSAKR